MIAFGPVPSRRLGHSLGINNIPAKTCSYSCVYCQLGNTIKMQVDRQAFYKPELIFEEVNEKVDKAESKGEPIDYLTFVPDGEPTLDIAIGEEIALLKTLGIKIAILTNTSLISQEDMRDYLALERGRVISLEAFFYRKFDRRTCSPFIGIVSIPDGLEFESRPAV